jgi:hypothetical protein
MTIRNPTYETLQEMLDAERRAAQALIRARAALVALETERSPEQIERLRHGAMHEIETAARLFGHPLNFYTGEASSAVVRAVESAKEEPELPFNTETSET